MADKKPEDAKPPVKKVEPVKEAPIVATVEQPQKPAEIEKSMWDKNGETILLVAFGILIVGVACWKMFKKKG